MKALIGLVTFGLIAFVVAIGFYYGQKVSRKI